MAQMNPASVALPALRQGQSSLRNLAVCLAFLAGCASGEGAAGGSPPASEVPPKPAPATVAAAGAPSADADADGGDAPSPAGAQSNHIAPPLSLFPVGGGAQWTLTLDSSGESCPDGFLIAFMASWCTYCTQSLPTLAQLEKDFPTLGVVTVTIDDSPSAQQAELARVRAAGLTGPVLVADASTRQAWTGAKGSVPRYVFVNDDGKIVAQDRGFGDRVKPMMPAQARRALKLPKE